MSVQKRRADIVEEARSWIGTPYLHQASAKGVGCDCLGLVRGVWRAQFGDEPEAMPAYSADWAERNSAETLLAAARRHLIPSVAPLPGDVLLFRMAPDAPMKHCAIMTAPDRIVHAYWGRAVVESRFSMWWASRLGAVFSYPGMHNG